MVTRNYFWSHCSRAVKYYVLDGEVCQETRGNVNKSASLEFYPSDPLPFEMDTMDTVGPLSATDNGRKFVSVFVVFFTRYAEIVPIKDGIISRVGHKVCVLMLFKRELLYKASQKFDVPYRVIEVLKLNKHRVSGCNLISGHSLLNLLTIPL